MKSRLIIAALLIGCQALSSNVSAQAIVEVLGMQNGPKSSAKPSKALTAAQKALCSNTVGNQTYVDLDKLAAGILNKLGFEAGDLGTLSQRSLAALIYAFENGAPYPVTNPDIPRVKSAVAAVATEAVSIQGILWDVENNPNKFANRGYAFHVPNPQFLNKPGEPTYLDLFAGKDAITIECLKLHERDSSTTIFHSFASFVADQSESRLRLRGKLSDITKPANKGNLLSLSAATVSYTDNNASGANTFAMNGVLGFDMSTPDGTVLLPYVEYKQSETRKGKQNTEVQVLNTGLLYNDLFLNPYLSFEIDVAPSITFDLEQGSEELSLSGSIDPAFDFFGIPVGVFSYHGPFRIRPSLLLNMEANYVLDAGTNLKLRTKDDYLRVGGKADLQIQFVDIPILSDVSLEGSYERYEFLSSPIDELERWEAGVNYFIGGSLNYLLSFKYAHGRNKRSLQKEDYWNVSFGARF